ncbi:hypothetical protein MKW92_017622 [Papaver armeniacum]|nr:hypothetical protein MKW92_017622 [Papaver armeniacum]
MLKIVLECIKLLFLYRKYICANGLDPRYLTVVRFCKFRWYGSYPVWSHVYLVICVCKLEFGIDGLIGFPGSRLGSKQKSFGDILLGTGSLNGAYNSTNQKCNAH